MTAIEPPKHIWYFLYAFLGTVVVSLFDIAAMWAGVSRQDLATSTFSNVIVGTMITLIFIFFIFRRKNWARIVYTVITVLNILIAFVTISREMQGDWIGAMSSCTQIALAIVSIAFLFTSQSRAWFTTSQQPAAAGGDGAAAGP